MVAVMAVATHMSMAQALITTTNLTVGKSISSRFISIDELLFRQRGNEQCKNTYQKVGARQHASPLIPKSRGLELKLEPSGLIGVYAYDNYTFRSAI